MTTKTTTQKTTKATIKSLMNRLNVSDYELDSDTVTIWYDLDSEKAAKKAMKAVGRALLGTVTNNGSKVWLQYKGTAASMGDWNDKTSPLHY